jgi:hypothetical protein
MRHVVKHNLMDSGRPLVQQTLEVDRIKYSVISFSIIIVMRESDLRSKTSGKSFPVKRPCGS